MFYALAKAARWFKTSLYHYDIISTDNVWSITKMVGEKTNIEYNH